MTRQDDLCEKEGANNARPDRYDLDYWVSLLFTTLPILVLAFLALVLTGPRGVLGPLNTGLFVGSIFALMYAAEFEKGKHSGSLLDLLSVALAGFKMGFMVAALLHLIWLIGKHLFKIIF